MNGWIVLAACVCTSTAQVYAPGLAVPYAAPSHQFHAQDEFGQFSFGHAGGPSARTEARNAYGVTTGSYQYIDANGLIQTVNYIADDVHGFRVQGTNLPVAPIAGVVAPLVAPVFDLPLPVAVVDTPEVAAAKAEFAAAYAAQVIAAGARKKRDADEVIAAPAVLGPALAYAGLPYPYAAGLVGGHGLVGAHGLAGAYGLAGAHGLAGAYGLAGAHGLGAYGLAGAHGLGAYGLLGAHGLASPLGFAAPGAIVADIAHPTPEVVAPAVYAGLPAALPLAHAEPILAAAPSREAVLTTIKLNPGHAVFYRVD